MKKSLIIFFFILFIQPCFAREVLAPAVQFDLKKYANYFKRSVDYPAYLKSRSDYKIICDSDIIGITWGDPENIKIYDEKNENGELLDMKSTVVKLRYETYSYIRLYKSTREIVNILLSVNPVFEEEKETNLGLCRIIPYKE